MTLHTCDEKVYRKMHHLFASPEKLGELLNGIAKEISDKAHLKEYVGKEITQMYLELKGKKPKKNSPVFEKLKDRVYYEFDILMKDIFGAKTIEDLIEQIVKHANIESSPCERDLIRESREFYNEVYG